MSTATPSHSKVRIGIVGCGKISDAYFKGLARYDVLAIAACADLDPARAQAKAAQYGTRACTVDELLADPDISVVVNLTVPQAHVPLNERALRAGKHVYTEKPFALNTADSARIAALGRELGLLTGSAPDTFLGAGHQTARKLIDDGVIGQPVAAVAFMLTHGTESWHPAPEFYYRAGGGPMFDMGPYYITALVNLLGPVARVSGSARASFPERLITSQPLAGSRIKVEVPTHYAGTIDFASGVVASFVTTFDVWPGPPMPNIVVYGSEGTLQVPDPNGFDGEVKLRLAAEKELRVVPPTHATTRSRGSGVADLAQSVLAPRRPHRCNGALAHHVVEVLESFERSSTSGRHVSIVSPAERPASLPVALAAGEFDS
jgi:predicted dehydrogenase